MQTHSILPAIEQLPWSRHSEGLERWKQGLTGYPIVDAGMRELAQTGWIHNRVRMITASFLIKHLLVHWSEGADWFFNNLLDADVASNYFNWQYMAGSMRESNPYFRIFNPVLQGKKFDTEGKYVKRWIPELQDNPIGLIHEPRKYNDMKKLIIITAGSGSREVLLAIEEINRISPTWEILGFVDENPDLIGKEIDGYPVFDHKKQNYKYHYCAKDKNHLQ